MNAKELHRALRSATPEPVSADLRDRLVADLPAALPGVSLPVRRRRWWAYAAAACLAGAVLYLAGLSWRGDQVSGSPGFSLVPAVFAEVVEGLDKATALELELEVRAPKGENFESVFPEEEFAPVHIWIERPSVRFAKGRMRVEKPTRRVVFNGDSTLIFMNAMGSGDARIYPGGQIDRLLADPARWLEDARDATQGAATMDTAKGADGRQAARLSLIQQGVELSPGAKPVFFDQFDRRTVVTWDIGSGELRSLERYVQYQGQEVLVARLRRIRYASRLDDSVFSLAVPEGAHWAVAKDADDPRWSAMGPVQVAQTLFEGWKEKDWDTVRRFCEYEVYLVYMKKVPLKSYRITGEPFRSDPRYPGVQIPYELDFGNGKVKRHALALRNDNEMQRYVIDGGL